MMANSYHYMGMCIRTLLLCLLSFGCVSCFPLNAPFLEGTEVLTKMERGTAIGGMLGTELVPSAKPMSNDLQVVPAFVAANRVGFGIGFRQELRVESAFSLPPFTNTMIKFSWKWQAKDWLAFIAGTGLHGGLINSGWYIGGAAGLFAVQDIGMILSTGVAEYKPGKRLRPYIGLRMTWVPRLSCWDGMCDHSLAPNASLGFRIATSARTVASFELGYSGRYRIELPGDAPFPQSPSDRSLPAMMHSLFLAGGVSWRWDPAADRAVELARLRSELFSELVSRADLAMAHGDYDSSIGFFERAKNVEDHAWLLCNIGEAYRRKLEWGQAKIAFQRCIDRDPIAQYVDAVKQVLREFPEVVP